MKKILLLIVQCMLVIACSDEDRIPEASVPGDGENCITLVTQKMEQIETRASEQDIENDSRIDHVILAVFDQSTGEKKLTFQQYLENHDRIETGNIYYKLHLLLSGIGSDVKICAICNYPEFWDVVNQSSYTFAQLESTLLKGQEGNAAFPGQMVMYGQEEVSVTKLQDKHTAITIPVKRVAAKFDLDVVFEPEKPTDQFFLSSMEIYNVPLWSNLVEKETDAVHYDFTGSPLKNPNEPESPASREDSKGCFLEKSKLKIHDKEEGGKHIYSSLFYLFENRNGIKEDAFYQKLYTDENSFQTLKGKVGRMEHPFASYVLLKGIYTSGTSTHKFTQDVSFYVYLGKNNYSDFNIERNSHYKVTATIKAVDDIDTRVKATILNQCTISPFFNNPVDAHYGVGRCFAYTENNDWELYVEEPDKHPWLEISFSQHYKPHLAGTQIPVGDEMLYANTFFKGTSALSQYFYVHVDEFIPENATSDEGLNTPSGKNIALDETKWRTGTIVLRDKINQTESRLLVKQRPAQFVRMPVKDALGHIKSYNDYYVEYELESKEILWGFLQYPANPVMTSMINDRWDGLANTRRLYQEAIKAKGAYNNTSTPPGTAYGSPEEAAKHLPETDLIGYVMTKNRDNNGNGCIDYDEIKWYVPALNELLELWRVIDENHLEIEDSEGRFHSSTPYLAGYTYEVPGRCFYVKTEKGKKRTAFTMRDRKYNVICCRRKNAWSGDADGEVDGNIDVNPDGWDDENDILPKH